MKNRNINGWIIQENKHNEFPATKSYIVFHPICDGHFWEQFDTIEEVKAFCTKETFDIWSRNLI
ncbi:hypothetical protein [Paenibacillus sp. ISL-20]|uniref:hypothetical protein n=1 Tax=Paenibacillus sp. ISL-20 TaxID=2819163 RepID=UPI001BEC5D2C|nr:hypothetical protein [Paenibacillus sp. ISL-20]MBT2759925.1 hypothetical protein [Paenibacillus sp. ISL-20]